MEFRDSDESSRLSTDAIQTQLNSDNSSPIDPKCNSLNASNLINNNNSSSSTNSTTSINLTNNNAQLALRSNEVHTVILYGIPIIALVMDNLERLCLAQISNTLLKDFSYNEIHNRRVALGINCVQCTPVQLELLRRAGAMPVSSRRCGMITKREAERLCKSFLTQTQPPKLPENYEFQIYHKCSYGCKGSFVPTRYNSSRAKCIKCYYCGLFFSPNKFIFHSHQVPGSKFVQADAANFNSWRRHIKLAEDAPDHVANIWEEVKAMFNGGSRKRAMSATLNSASRQHQHQKQQLARNLVSNALISTTSTGSTVSNLSNTRNRKSSNQSLSKSKNSSKNIPIPEIDEDEELVVDDDFKPSNMHQNLLNSQLFSSNHLQNSTNNLDDDQINGRPSSAIPLNLLTTNYHNKILNQHHPLATFAPFRGNSNSLNNLNNNLPTNDLTALNTTANLTHRSSSQNNASSLGNTLNCRTQSTNNGQLDVVQAMLPMLGQEFIWPSHPLNSLTQLSNLNNLPSQTCSPSNLASPHLNTLLPNQQSTNSNLSQPHKTSTFPIMYNNNSPSLLFAHHNLTNAPTFDHHPKNILPVENWFNRNVSASDSSANANNSQSSAFKKVNTINKLLEDNQSTKKSCNDFSVENLSKSKRTKLINEHHKRTKADDEEVDVEGEEELNKNNTINKDTELNENHKNAKLNNNLKSTLLTDKLKNSHHKKKTNSLDDVDRSSEELSEGCSSPVRSQSANESNRSVPILNLLNESTCQDDNCQLNCCNKRSSSTSQLIGGNLICDETLNLDSKLIDLSNVNTLIKNSNQEMNKSNKELDLVNNIMAFNKLMNRNYPNEVLFKEEIEKRIELINYIRNSFNNVNKPEYVHHKL